MTHVIKLQHFMNKNIIQNLKPIDEDLEIDQVSWVLS